MRRSRGQVVLTGVYVLLALNAWAQVIAVPLGGSDDPLALTGLQLLVGAAGAAAAWGSWSSARWVPAAALVHGAVTAGMLLALLPLLDLGSEARGGLWLGASARASAASIGDFASIARCTAMGSTVRSAPTPFRFVVSSPASPSPRYWRPGLPS